MTKTALLTLAFSLFAWPGRVAAQTPDCSAAGDSLTAGSRDGAAWGVLSLCPEEAEHVAAAIRLAAMETDTVFLADLVGVAAQMRDWTVAQAAMDVVADPSAAAAPRLAAQLIVLGQLPVWLAPNPITGWEDLLAGQPGAPCLLVSGGPIESIGAIPAGFDSTLLDHVRNFASDGTAPAAVRHLYSCAYQVAGYGHPVPADQIEVARICERKFLVTNTSQFPAPIRFAVDETDEAGSINLQPFEEFVLVVFSDGLLRVSSGTELVAAVSTGATPCQP